MSELVETCRALLQLENEEDLARELGAFEARLQSAPCEKPSGGASTSRECTREDAESKANAEGYSLPDLAWALLVLVKAYRDALGAEDLLELVDFQSRRALLLVRNALDILRTHAYPDAHVIATAATLVRLTLELGFASTVFSTDSSEGKSTCDRDRRQECKEAEGLEADCVKRTSAVDCTDGCTPLKQCTTLYAQHLRVLFGTCARESLIESAHALLAPSWRDELRKPSPSQEAQNSLDDFFELAMACQSSVNTFRLAADRREKLAPLLAQAPVYTRSLLVASPAPAPGRVRAALWACVVFSTSTSSSLEDTESAVVVPALRFAIAREHADIFDLGLRLAVNTAAPATIWAPLVAEAFQQIPLFRTSALQRLQSASIGMRSPVKSQSAVFGEIIDAITSNSEAVSEAQLDLDIDVEEPRPGTITPELELRKAI